MIAAGLGWTLYRIEENIEPKLAEKPVESEYPKVEPGHVAKLDQKASDIIGNEPVIVLNLQASLGCATNHASDCFVSSVNLPIPDYCAILFPEIRQSEPTRRT